MTDTTKYGLFFLGGVVVGALGAVAITRGKLDVKPLATDLLSTGIDLRDKVMAGVEGVKEDLADVMAEAQVKSQERKLAKEAQEAQEAQTEIPSSETAVGETQSQTAV